MYKIKCDICGEDIGNCDVVRCNFERTLITTNRTTKEICYQCYVKTFEKTEDEIEQNKRKNELEKLNKLAGIKCE